MSSFWSPWRQFYLVFLMDSTSTWQHVLSSWHCSKPFPSDNSHNPHTIPWSRSWYCPSFQMRKTRPRDITCLSHPASQWNPTVDHSSRTQSKFKATSSSNHELWSAAAVFLSGLAGAMAVSGPHKCQQTRAHSWGIKWVANNSTDLQKWPGNEERRDKLQDGRLVDLS